MLLLCIALIFFTWFILHTWRMYRMSLTLKEILYPCLPLPIIGQAYKLISLTVVADAEVAMKVCNMPTCLDKGELTKFLVDVVGQGSIFAPETVLGKKFEQDKKSGQQFARSLDLSLEILVDRIMKPWLQVDVVYKLLPKYEELMGHVRFIWSLISKRISEVREEIKSKKSCDCLKEDEPTTFVPFLKTLIDHSGGDRGYTNLELREEILVLLIAAIDTSAVAMGFVCLLLARHPDVQEKVHQELFEVFQESSRRLTTGDLFRLQYLEAVIKETLRLYPPAPLLSRQNRDTVTLHTGITLPKNADIIFSTHGINKNPLYWGNDADEFKPERWLTETKTNPAAFMSFNYGVRNCPGYKYALTSIKTVLSTMLRRYRIVPENVENKNVRVSFKIMLNPVDGYQIQLEDKYIQK